VGTLERHITTPFGFAPVALLKGVAKVIRTFLTSAVVLAVMLLLTGTRLSLDPITVVPVAGLAITSVLGLGFAAGGVTVLYKRIGNWLNLLQFGFIALISAPVLDAPWTRFLPWPTGARCSSVRWSTASGCGSSGSPIWHSSSPSPSATSSAATSSSTTRRDGRVGSASWVTTDLSAPRPARRRARRRAQLPAAVALHRQLRYRRRGSVGVDGDEHEIRLRRQLAFTGPGRLAVRADPRAEARSPDRVHVRLDDAGVALWHRSLEVEPVDLGRVKLEDEADEF